MVKEAYVSFEVAKLLKEKGFNKPCHSYYKHSHGKTTQEWSSVASNRSVYESEKGIEYINAPTHQMAMAWLREKHIYLVFKPAYFSGEDCTYWSYEKWAGDNFEGEVLSFKSYEEAVEDALKYSLENLI